MPFRFQYRRYRLPFRTPIRTAHGPWTEREGVIVRLEDVSERGAGRVGFGEAAPIPWFGTETVDEVETGCRSIGEWIEQTALEQVAEKLGCLRHALAGAFAGLDAERREPGTKAEVDTRDPKGTLGNALPASGGGSLALDRRVRNSYLSVAALLPAGRAALAQIAPKADIGFRVFKWKVGVGDLADEIALLDDICAELPSGARLRLDANGAWDRRRAERWLERCADRPVEFVEQPCFADASQGATLQRKTEDVLFGLAGNYPTPIALDESIVGERDLERWIGAGWPGLFVVKPSLLADVSAALQQLEKAKARVVFSSALETALGAKSALQAAFAWKGELDTTGADKESGPSSAGAAAGEPGDKTQVAVWRTRALGFGVWPLFSDARFDGPAAAPFVRFEDVAAINAEAIWNALS